MFFQMVLVIFSNVWLLCVTRFVWGIGIGMVSTVSADRVYTYIFFCLLHVFYATRYNACGCGFESPR